VNGAEALICTLVAGGVEVCFTNPGTSEMHIVAALDRSSGMRSILGLFEGVVTAAADGYARMAEKPACTLLHLGPGLANGVANLHNASRAQVPIVNIIGQHALHHLRYNAPLTSDIEAIARPYSNWLRTTTHPSNIGRDTAELIAAARTPPGQIATLVVPADVAWTEGAAVAEVPEAPRPALSPSESVDRTASMLRSGAPTALLLAGTTLYGTGLKMAGRIAAATGAKLLAPYPIARVERGANAPAVQRIPYVPDQAIELLKGFRQLILVGTAVPASYFAYPGKSGVLTSAECEPHTLATPGQDYVGALDAVASALSIRGGSPNAWVGKAEKNTSPTGEISLPGVAAAVASSLPENVIVVDESMTSGRGIMAASASGPPQDWLCNTGGSIGIALPLAVGAAVACPERRVLCLTADGSGMYTLQALWTMARESLNITTVVFANRSYAVLQREFSGLGVGTPGPQAAALFDIGRPPLDWVHLAKGMGVPGTRISTLDDLTKALQDGFAADGPSLIEIPL
jgi:acetolactate synthase I/II/III large subunit